MGQNRLDSTLFLLSLKLSSEDLCLKNPYYRTHFALKKMKSPTLQIYTKCCVLFQFTGGRFEFLGFYCAQKVKSSTPKVL